MRILVTAGPTREWIDRVRFISNPSTGLMGHAVARAAADAGHAVTLVRGPVVIEPPSHVETVDVVTAEEMRVAVLDLFPQTDCVVMAAAVADYAPAETLNGKRKKQPGEWNLRLVRTPDILAELGRLKKRQRLIGFALETQQSRENALKKLREKNLDAIVLNDPSAFGSETGSVEIFTCDRSPILLPNRPKREIAERIVSLAEELGPSAAADRNGQPLAPSS